MQTPARILIVDDDLETRKLLGRYLTDPGYRVSLASDQRTTKEALLVGEVSLIVLDVLLPDGSGHDVCRDLRREGSDIPVIILMALKEDVDRIIGLEIGADEYLGKPFNPRELRACIRAVLRRSPNGFCASRARLAQLAGSQPHSAAASLVRYCRMNGLISIGVIGAALIIAHQATKQLKFLETMAKAVGNDGILPRVPEEGSAEIKPPPAPST
jgi:DNA-binding response OmpR family regulator